MWESTCAWMCLSSHRWSLLDFLMTVDIRYYREIVYQWPVLHSNRRPLSVNILLNLIQSAGKLIFPVPDVSRWVSFKLKENFQTGFKIKNQHSDDHQFSWMRQNFAPGLCIFIGGNFLLLAAVYAIVQLKRAIIWNKILKKRDKTFSLFRSSPKNAFHCKFSDCESSSNDSFC